MSNPNDFSTVFGELTQYEGNDSKVVIPSTVKRIGEYAFCDCENIESITIPQSVRRICNYAFYGCKGLTSITIPKTVRYIGVAAFSKCTNLKSVTVSPNILKIDFTKPDPNYDYDLNEFYSTLSEYKSSYENIFDFIFDDYKKMGIYFKDVPFEDIHRTYKTPALLGFVNNYEQENDEEIIQSYLKYAKNQRKRLYEYIKIHEKLLFFMCKNEIIPVEDCDKVLEIVKDNVELTAYINDYKASTFTLEDEIKAMNKLKHKPLIRRKPDWNTAKIDDESVRITGYNGDDLDIVIPAKVGSRDVTTIGNNAFSPLKQNIGEDRKNIYANFKSIFIPNSVTCILEAAFWGCEGLTSITIPKSVENIEKNPIWKCKNLTSITVENGNKVYDNRNNCNGIIETATNTLISACKNTIIPESVTAIKYAYTACNITSITIPNSVTCIGDEAFHSCSGLTSITLPNSIKSIGKAAFAFCRGLTSITIPESVKKIDEEAFLYCTELTSIAIPKSVRSIGEKAFSNCNELTSITIPNSVKKIKDYTFSNCFELTSITLPNSLTYIGKRAFYDCKKLTSITLPESVKHIEELAFYGCSGLTSITIPDSVTTIEKFAFHNCTGLTSVTLPNSITCIEESTFKGCTGLTSVTIPDSVKYIGDWAFEGCTELKSITIPNSVTSIGHFALPDNKEIVIYTQKDSEAYRHFRSRKIVLI